MLLFGLLGLSSAVFLTKTSQIPTTQVKENQCHDLDPIDRSDCGRDAAINSGQFELTENKCLNFGCCWDLDTYLESKGFGINVPICFYSGRSFIYIEEVVVKKPAISAGASVNAAGKIVEQPSKLPVYQPVFQPTLPPTTKKTTTKSATFTKKQSDPEKKFDENSTVNNEPVKHDDLVTSYRKKTCLQISSSTLNETMIALTMEKMLCDTVDFKNYDPDEDANLKQSSENGMKILMDKFKESDNQPEIIAGGKTAVILDPAEQTAKLLEDRMKKMLIREKTNSKDCKNLEAQYAKEKKSSFGSKEKRKFEEVCGRVPDTDYMSGLIASIVINNDKKKEWKLPDKKLKMELVQWEIMEKCINRKKYLLEEYDCFIKSEKIFNQETCFNHGCIYHEKDCFFCADALLSMDDMAMALQATSAENAECAAPSAKRNPCKDYDTESDSLVSKMMQMQMLSNPSMGLFLESRNKKKCENLGCCYEKNEKAMIMQMMMGPQAAQSTMDPMQMMMSGMSGGSSMSSLMSMMGRKRRETDLNSMMMSMMGGNSMASGMNMMGSNTLSMASDPMNALLMKKFGAKEASSCYEKLDLAATEFHKCVPDKVKMECGVSNAPSATTTQPWNVVIANSAGNIHCGGVLICSSWVISTASCLTKLEETVTDFPQIDMYIDITDASNLSIATKLNVKRIVYNPLFTKNYFGRSRLIHDIVAIQIHTLTNMPICLPKLTGENVKIGESIFSLGHGKFGSDLAQKAGNLKLGEFEAVKTSVCTEKYGDIDFSSSVCASLANPAHNFEVCAGDNGGATATYMDAWTLSGLISGGPEDCNLENIPAIFTSIQKDLQWILETTNNCCRSTTFR